MVKASLTTIGYQKAMCSVIQTSCARPLDYREEDWERLYKRERQARPSTPMFRVILVGGPTTSERYIQVFSYGFAYNESLLPV